jgi:tetratricopeptide (TPR) repeat protein
MGENHAFDHKGSLMTDGLIQRGLEAAARGDLQQASGFFTQAVKANPSDENAWLYLGHTLTQPDRREYCYNQVLRLTPANEQAKISLEHLHAPAPVPRVDLTPTLPQEIPAPPRPQSPQPPAATEKPGRGVAIFGLWLLFGLLGSMLLCLGPFAFLLYTGRMDGAIQSWQEAVETVQNGGTIGSETANSATLIPYDSVEGYLKQAADLMDQSDYRGAIPYWQKALDLNPQNDHAHYQLALCYYVLAISENVQTEYYAEVEAAKQNIDRAIELQPENYDYYMTREYIAINFSVNVQNRSDRLPILAQAEQDLIHARSLADASKTDSVDLELAQVYLYSNQCQSALETIEPLTSRVNTSIPKSYSAVKFTQAEALACLGQFDQAIPVIQEAQAVDVKRPEKQFAEALYRFQSGDTDAAQQIIDTLINEQPSFMGKRYYLRAAIYFSQGKSDLAKQDLVLGEKYTFDRGGIYNYVQAQLALEAGDTQKAISWLQQAENTFAPAEETLHQKTLDQITDLGGSPLVIPPSYTFPGVVYPSGNIQSN